MHTLRLWTLWLLWSLLTPLAWGQAPQTAPTPSPTPAQVQAHVRMPCHGPTPADMSTAAPAAKPAMAQHQAQAGCGDCSACHVLALWPADWQLHGPALVEATPGWHATPDGGRLKGCELYRPPQA